MFKKKVVVPQYGDWLVVYHHWLVSSIRFEHQVYKEMSRDDVLKEACLHKDKYNTTFNHCEYYIVRVE